MKTPPPPLCINNATTKDREGRMLDFVPIGLTRKELHAGRWGCQFCINLADYTSPKHGRICSSHFMPDELKIMNRREKFVPKMPSRPSVLVNGVLYADGIPVKKLK